MKLEKDFILKFSHYMYGEFCDSGDVAAERLS